MKHIKQPQNTVLSGPAMREHLSRLGIEPQKVTFKRDARHYIADFYVPEMQIPVRPAREYAHIMQQRLQGVRIIETHDTVATWRSGQPIIFATVAFTLDGR